MDNQQINNNPSPQAVITKRGVKMDFEGKIPFKQRLVMRLTSSSFWIDRVWYLFRFILMVGICFVILSPFLKQLLKSVWPLSDFSNTQVYLIPTRIDFNIYVQLAKHWHYLSILRNTLILSVLSAALQTFVTCMIGYGLAKFRFKGNKLVLILVIITMAIPHRTLSLSLFQHFGEFDFFAIQATNKAGLIELLTHHTLRLTNTYWPFAILSATGLAFKNGLYIFMMRQFFHGVPDELEESAYVDGSGTFRTFFTIILPLSVPMMITIFLFAFSWQWTDSFYTNLFFSSSGGIGLMPDLLKSPPPALQVNNIAIATPYYDAIKNAGGLMVIFPLVIVFLFCQRYLVQGIERSGIVG